MLVDHARTELIAAGLFDDDSDYGGMLGNAVLKLIEVFADQRHSGYSASITIDLFTRLARFENLTPLTDNPDEWEDVGYDLWQNTRSPAAFSKDGGKTYTINGTDDVVSSVPV